MLTLATGCATAPAGRPTTPASLRIVSPAADAVVGSDVDLEVELRDARIVAAGRSDGPLRTDRGHVHVSVDGKPTAMAYERVQRLRDLGPGPHWIEVEFVATDHLPFRNVVTASVDFTVR